MVDVVDNSVETRSHCGCTTMGSPEEARNYRASVAGLGSKWRSKKCLYAVLVVALLLVAILLAGLFLCVVHMNGEDSSVIDCSPDASVISTEFLTRKLSRHMAIACSTIVVGVSRMPCVNDCSKRQQGLFDSIVDLYSKYVGQKLLLAEVAHTVVYLSNRNSSHVQDELVDLVRVVDEVRRDLCEMDQRQMTCRRAVDSIEKVRRIVDLLDTLTESV